jgi:hypothetical protein
VSSVIYKDVGLVSYCIYVILLITFFQFTVALLLTPQFTVGLIWISFFRSRSSCQTPSGTASVSRILQCFSSVWNCAISFHLLSSCLSESLFKFSYLCTYGCSAKKHTLLQFLFLLPVHYRRYVYRQAGYQRSSVLVVTGTLPQKHAFRNRSHMFSSCVG